MRDRRGGDLVGSAFRERPGLTGGVVEPVGDVAEVRAAVARITSQLAREIAEEGRDGRSSRHRRRERQPGYRSGMFDGQPEPAGEETNLDFEDVV